MCQITFIQLSLLLIIMVEIVIFVNGMYKNDQKLIEPLSPNEQIDQQCQFEVIEDNGTTEEKDMEKAIQISKRIYWLLMMEKWECNKSNLSESINSDPRAFKLNRLPIGTGIESNDDLLKFCRKWKMMAIVADKYVKEWEREKCQKSGEVEEGTSSKGPQKTRKMEKIENPLQCHFVKPILQIEKRELQMSSAMEAIKAVFRDLFLWGKGNRLESLKNKVQFANEKEVEDFGRMIEKLDCQNPDESTEDNKLECQEHSSDNLLKLYGEKMNEFDKQFKRHFIELKITKNEIEKPKKDYDILLEIWELAEEIGLDFGNICEAEKNYKKDYNNANLIQKSLYNFKSYSLLTAKFYLGSFINQFPISTYEQQLGKGFMAYKEKYDKMEKKKDDAKLNIKYAKVPKNDAEEMKLLPDPCEQAKLKWKKN